MRESTGKCTAASRGPGARTCCSIIIMPRTGADVRSPSYAPSNMGPPLPYDTLRKRLDELGGCHMGAAGPPNRLRLG